MKVSELCLSTWLFADMPDGGGCYPLTLFHSPLNIPKLPQCRHIHVVNRRCVSRVTEYLQLFVGVVNKVHTK